MVSFVNSAPLDKMNVNFGRISTLIFDTFDWFVSKSETLGRRTIDQWVQVQDDDGVNAISVLFTWIGYLKLVFSNTYILTKISILYLGKIYIIDKLIRICISHENNSQPN